MIPNPIIEEIDGFLVVRDDLLLGGSKVRAIDALMNGSSEYVYASPASGYAQIALAIGCRERKKKATIFTAQRKRLHDRTLEAQSFGASVVQVPFGYLTNVQAKARAYAREKGASLLPFGFDSPKIRQALADAARDLKVDPPEVWCVAGSGTLSRALQEAWPQAKHYAVKIGSEPKTGNAELLTAPEKFEACAKLPPPFPSCVNYDAKAWRFIKAKATAGALFWNVAK